MASNSTNLSYPAGYNDATLTVSASVSGSTVYGTATLYTGGSHWSGYSNCKLKLSIGGVEVRSESPNFTANGQTASYDGSRSGLSGSVTVTATWSKGATANYIPVSGSVSTTVTITPSYSHKITYYANGGTGAPSSQTSSNSSQTSFTATLSATVPTRDKYTFLGWSESNSATTADYQPSTQYSFSGSQNVDLYAVWKKDVNIYLGTTPIDKVCLGSTEVSVKYGNLDI